MPARKPARPAAAAAAAGGRAPWGTISRPQIVDAATEIVGANRGVAELTIRGLAAGLGVAPMSIYRHIDNKDDLLDEVVDRLLADVWRPGVGEHDWRAWIVESAENLRRFLVDQPAALHVYLRHPLVSPTAAERMAANVRVLRTGTRDDATARRAYAALQTYTIGFAALEASRADWNAADNITGRQSDQLVAYTTPRQFFEGLGYLLDGIERNSDDRGRTP